CCNDVGRGQPPGVLHNIIPVDSVDIEASQPTAHCLLDRLSIRQLIWQYEIKATQDGPVKNLRKIRRRDHDRRASVLIEELQERIQNPTRLTNVVVGASRSRERVNLVEQINASVCPHRIENHSQL